MIENVKNIIVRNRLMPVCGVYLPTHHCRSLWQQMLTEPLYMLQDNHPAQQQEDQYSNKRHFTDF